MRVRGHMTLATLIVASLSLASPALAADAPPSPLQLGGYAPRFLLKTMNPEASGLTIFSTKRYVGSRATEQKQALLLSFAASHCGPCKKELPQIAELEQRYRGRGVIAAVVVIDQEQEGRDAMRQLLVDELGATFPVLADTFAVVGRRYGADVLPLNVVIDGEGRVVWFQSGFQPDTIKAADKQLARLAGPPAGNPPAQ